jgi:hypothetical protein
MQRQQGGIGERRWPAGQGAHWTFEQSMYSGS